MLAVQSCGMALLRARVYLGIRTGHIAERLACCRHARLTPSALPANRWARWKACPSSSRCASTGPCCWQFCVSALLIFLFTSLCRSLQRHFYLAHTVKFTSHAIEVMFCPVHAFNAHLHLTAPSGCRRRWTTLASRPPSAGTTPPPSPAASTSSRSPTRLPCSASSTRAPSSSARPTFPHSRSIRGAPSRPGTA